VKPNQLAKDLPWLSKNKISAVGVVNENGELIGNLSLTDLRSIGEIEGLAQLNLPIKGYQQRIEALSSERTIPHYKYPVKANETDTLDSIIQTLITYNIHRIYIVDNLNKPIGILSLIDILQELFDEPC